MKKKPICSSILFLFALTAMLFPRIGIAEPIVMDGLIEPSLVVNVGSSVPGILHSVDAERGDMVNRGQVLARLKSGVERATAELALARAEMTAPIKLKRERLDYSRRQVKRTEELYNKKAVPFSQMDEVQTNQMLAELEVLEEIENKRLAGLELQRANEVVDRLTIRSPISGVVMERFLSQGEYVEEKPILKIAQIDPLHVEIIAPVKLLGALRMGMNAEVRPEEPHARRYSATVTIVDRVVDAASGTFGVRLELSNPGYKLPAGLKCKVLFIDN